MASKNLSSFFFLILIFSLFALTSQLPLPDRHLHRRRRIASSSATSPNSIKPHLTTSLFLQTFSFATITQFSPSAAGTSTGAGEWTLLQESIGVSAMHMQLLHNNKVVIFDRTDFGSSNLTLPMDKCRYNDEVMVPKDCTAHSLLYDVASNSYRPLDVETDVWCSSGAVSSNGTLIQTGGYHSGDHKIRLFSPCDDDLCDWVELEQQLGVQRWYSTDQILPDGRVIIVGGRRAFSYEFYPKAKNDGVFYFNFLKETTDPKEENNLYPFLHLLPDGNLFIFANRRSIVFDYVNNTIVREFPVIPGEKRSYPATGSSVLLPLRLNGPSPEVEVMVCGGAMGRAYIKAVKGVYAGASKSCGRLRVSDPDPKWVMELMPMGRVMSDMLLLPTGDVIILNGAGKGTAGWECAINPVLNPLIYNPDEKRFSVLNPSTRARMYHSAATLLPDGRILVGGSNPHRWYNFTGVKYPTDLSLEAFSPPYMAPEYSHLRPSILSLEGPTDNSVSYGQQFAITFSMGLYQPVGEYTVTMVAPSFTTHSFAMNQRLLVLQIMDSSQLSAFAYRVTVHAPQTANIAPPGYYMVFVVHQGVPSHCLWIRMK